MFSASMGGKQYKAEQTKCVVAGCMATNNGEYSPSGRSKYHPFVDMVSEDANYEVDPALSACRGSLSVANERTNLNDEKNKHHSSKQQTKRDVSSSSPTEFSLGEYKNKDVQASEIRSQNTISSSLDVGNWHAFEISSEKVIERSSPASSAEDNSGAFNDNVFVQGCACKVCNCLDNPLKMLICDRCEDTFHLSCCVPKVKTINFDEWYCENCIKKQRKLWFGLTKRGKKPRNLLDSSGYKKKLWNGSSIIFSMLDATEPYDSGVRIGAAFQARVPWWSGHAVSEADSYYDEPEELDVKESLRLNAKKPNEDSKQKLMSNWLQCQEVLSNKTDQSGKEVICGKWRRAPLFEVQTDEWTCFDSVAWDRSRSDCAVPQEISTKDIMSHLKYIKLLKERLENKKRKSSE